MSGAPFVQVGYSGRVLHESDCPAASVEPDAVLTYMTHEEALRFLAMWGNRPCQLCQPVLTSPHATLETLEAGGEPPERPPEGPTGSGVG